MTTKTDFWLDRLVNYANAHPKNLPVKAVTWICCAGAMAVFVWANHVENKRRRKESKNDGQN